VAQDLDALEGLVGRLVGEIMAELLHELDQLSQTLGVLWAAGHCFLNGL
jgi:hypothetical protein